MHWCDICRCWMNDNKQAISNHERGMGHQENLKRSELLPTVGGQTKWVGRAILSFPWATPSLCVTLQPAAVKWDTCSSRGGSSMK